MKTKYSSPGGTDQMSITPEEPSLEEALALRLSTFAALGYPNKALRTIMHRANKVIERAAEACVERITEGLCTTCWGDGFHRGSETLLSGPCHACNGTGRPARAALEGKA